MCYVAVGKGKFMCYAYMEEKDSLYISGMLVDGGIRMTFFQRAFILLFFSLWGCVSGMEGSKAPSVNP